MPQKEGGSAKRRPAGKNPYPDVCVVPIRDAMPDVSD